MAFSDGDRGGDKAEEEEGFSFEVSFFFFDAFAGAVSVRNAPGEKYCR